MVGNLSPGISRWNCINLSSRNGALSFFRYRAGSISRGGPRCFTLLSITSISFRTPENPGASFAFGAGERPKESHMAEHHPPPERERDTRGGQWDGCYFHATFDFPLRVTGISLFIFRLLNYIPINKLPAHRLPYLPFHRLRGKDNPFSPRHEIVYLEKERRKLNFFFSSLLKGLVGI